MGETVHLLIGFDNYYPSPDNTVRVFDDKERAESICQELQEIHGRPDHKELYAELREKYEWLPEYSSEIYDVRTHECWKSWQRSVWSVT